MKRGFTLVEMTVVLAIIALATHLALRELSGHRDAKMERMADRQLETLREASVSFLGDMGRLVAATNGTLSELWEMPAGVRPFAIRAAAASNFVKGVSSDLETPGVFVPTGWKGPYVRIPPGKTRLFDPWGNPIETEDAAGLPRIGLTNEIHAAEVSHYGAAAQAKGKRTLPLLPERGYESVLRVKVISTNGNTSPGTDGIIYKWFGPADGAITGAVAKADWGTYAEFRGLTPGRRIIYDSVSKTSREIEIEPGDTNLIEIKVP